jgi:hypothetical protein
MSFWANVFWANVFWANVVLGKCLWANVVLANVVSPDFISFYTKNEFYPGLKMGTSPTLSPRIFKKTKKLFAPKKIPQPLAPLPTARERWSIAYDINL